MNETSFSVVLNEQDSRPCHLRGGQGRSTGYPALGRLNESEAAQEGRSHSEVAFYADRSTEEFDQALGEGKSEAGSLDLVCNSLSSE